jgi:hypothetical protein
MPKSTLDHKTELKASRERLYFLHPGYILLLSTAPVVAGFFSGIQLLLPLLITIPSAFVMWRWLLRGKVGTAYAEMLLSCLWMSIPLVLLPLYFPSRAEVMIIKGADYVKDMQDWINTGDAMEGTPSLFIPEHLTHMAIIAVASFFSAGFIALFFGAIQMGYMNYYVAWLITESGGDSSAYMLGWPVWSIIRVLSFVLLAVALAQPVVRRFNWKEINIRLMVWLVAVAIVLEGVDIGLKMVLGPVNQSVLHRVIHGTGDTVAALLTRLHLL